jgi:hypothetical protein
MASDQQGPDMEPIKLDLDDAPESNGPVPVPPPAQRGPVPVPVPPPAGSGGPVPVPPPAPRHKTGEETPIQLVDAVDVPTATRKAFGSGAARTGFEQKTEYKREINITGEGATRCKLWHCRLADGPLLHMESLINEWIDENEVEVKFVTQTIGTLEGKRSEPNLLVMLWY